MNDFIEFIPLFPCKSDDVKYFRLNRNLV